MANNYNKRKEQEEPALIEETSAAMPAACEEVEPKVDFDAWFAMRGSKIPPQHHKEIVKADFKGRGLSQHESLEDFDAALRKYGIKLA